MLRPHASHRSASVTLFAVACIVAGIVAEGAVRVYGVVDAPFGAVIRSYDALSAKIQPQGDFGFRPKPNSVFRYSNGTVSRINSMGYRGPIVSVPKPRGTFRVILLGGSTTHG